MQLEKIATVNRGIGTTKRDLDPAAGKLFRIIQVRHMVDGKIVPPKELKTVYLSPERDVSRWVVKAGDILVAMVGAKPKVVVVDKTQRSCLADKGVGIVRASSVENRIRIEKYLTSKGGLEKLASLPSGVTVPNMKISDLKVLKVR